MHNVRVHVVILNEAFPTVRSSSPGSPHAVVMATVVVLVDNNVAVAVRRRLRLDLDEGRADVDVGLRTRAGATLLVVAVVVVVVVLVDGDADVLAGGGLGDVRCLLLRLRAGLGFRLVGVHSLEGARVRSLLRASGL